MSFEHHLKVSMDRVGVLVGKGGNVKAEIEKVCRINLKIDSKTGDVIISAGADLSEANPLKAVAIIEAIARGFSPKRAFALLGDDIVLEIADLREHAAKSSNALERIKGRIIGLNGKTRQLIEDLTGALISVQGHSVSAIGVPNEVRLAMDAVDMLASGSPHSSVYSMLQRERRKAKMERMKLWKEPTTIE